MAPGRARAPPSPVQASGRLPQRYPDAQCIPIRGPRRGPASAAINSTCSGSGFSITARKNGAETSSRFHCSGIGPGSAPQRSPRRALPCRLAKPEPRAICVRCRQKRAGAQMQQLAERFPSRGCKTGRGSPDFPPRARPAIFVSSRPPAFPLLQPHPQGSDGRVARPTQSRLHSRSIRGPFGSARNMFVRSWQPPVVICLAPKWPIRLSR